MPWGTKLVARLVIGSLNQAPPSDAMGTRDIDLDTAREDQVLPAGAHLGGDRVDGLQTRGAEAVLLDAGHGVRQSGRDGGDAGDVGALVADGPTTPSTMSSTAAGSRSGKRARISWIRPTTRSTGSYRAGRRSPCRVRAGVRIASYTYASVVTGRPFH